MRIRDNTIIHGIILMTLPTLYFVWDVYSYTSWTPNILFLIGATLYFLGVIIVIISQFEPTEKKSKGGAKTNESKKINFC